MAKCLEVECRNVLVGDSRRDENTTLESELKHVGEGFYGFFQLQNVF